MEKKPVTPAHHHDARKKTENVSGCVNKDRKYVLPYVRRLEKYSREVFRRIGMEYILASPAAPDWCGERRVDVAAPAEVFFRS